MLIEQLPMRINFPYKETMEILHKDKDAREIIFLINSVFPSQAPHSLLASAGMEHALMPSLAMDLA